jgi:biopolymer transport protein TolR
MAFRMHSDRKAAMSEINVTPLVDVMLVLLIIFMVTAPMMQEGLTIDLPEAKAPALEKDQKVETTVIEISDKGVISVNGTPVSESDLVEAINKATAKDPKREVYLRGDKTVHYGVVVRIMGALMNAGITNLNIITSSPKESAPAK